MSRQGHEVVVDGTKVRAGLPRHTPLQPHFMVVPSLACPATCSYCFGPHRGPTMTGETMATTLDFIARVVADTGQRKVTVTFHGGEPLVAGHALWRQALGGLRSRFGVDGCKIALQSNLWLLDDEFCALFREHQVEIGTSLDGPEELTDAQRGPGHFARTMAGIRRAENHGMTVGCIATFTPRTLPRWREIFDFFLQQRLGFSIHAAVPRLQCNEEGAPRPAAAAPAGSPRHQLTPTEYASLLRQMLDYYVDNRRELIVPSLDQMCQGLVAGDGKVCSFSDCLGMFLAIDPSGGIYPCQRFCGDPVYRLGSLRDQPTLAQLLASPLALRLAARQEETRQACGACAHHAYCKGGCAYNAWAAAGGRPQQPVDLAPSPAVDPYCAAYRAIFDHIRQRLAAEMVTGENIHAVAARLGDGPGHPLLRAGPLSELARGGRHPSQIARSAKRIVAAVELANGPDIPTVAARLVAMGVCRTPQTAASSLLRLWRQLHPEQVRRNNLYLHVTFACQLRCTHCYADAGTDDPGGARPSKSAGVMSVTALDQLMREAHDAGFRQVIITGGEPLTHPRRDELLALLAQWRQRFAGTSGENMSPSERWRRVNIVLRTNFGLPLNDADLHRIAAAFDQVVVSVDGSERTHDARRGRGTYAATVRNLEACQAHLAAVTSHLRHPAELSLACVMSAAEIQGAAGAAVRQLARRLNIRRTRFRPLLPLGRAQAWNEPPQSEALSAHADPLDLIANGFQPVASCGLGQNLYVEPSGESFPCYAYHRPHSMLGNVIALGLPAILASERFRGLSRHTVDTNPRCRRCALRYLCGGACRAWGGNACQHNLDAPPPECDGLRARAAELHAAATAYLSLKPLPPPGDHTPCLHR